MDDLWVPEEHDETDEVERASEADTDKQDQSTRKKQIWSIDSVGDGTRYSVHHRCWKMNLQKTNWTRRRTCQWAPHLSSPNSQSAEPESDLSGNSGPNSHPKAALVALFGGDSDFHVV